MHAKPQFRACYRVESLENGAVLVLTETDYRVLTGHAEQLVPLLDGTHTLGDIYAATAGRIPADEVGYVLRKLREHGYLVGTLPDLPPQEAAYWDGLGAATHKVAERLAAIPVGLTTLGPLDGTPLKTALEALGLTVHTGDAQSGAIQVVITDTYLRADLEALNASAVRDGRPLLLVKPTGVQPWVGPLIVPGETGCWACMAQRLRTNRPAETFLRDRLGTSNGALLPLASLPSTQHLAFQMAATEVAKWLAHPESSTLVGTLLSLDTRTFATERHTLVRRPQCACCGTPEPAVPQPLRLVPRTKRFTADGGHRTMPPAETFAQYQHHISPLTGVVQRFKRIAAADDALVHSYAVGHNHASRFEGQAMIYSNLRDISGGKGRTDVQARASGLCEGIERYSGVYTGDEPKRTATYAELGEDAILPNALMHISERQYAQREHTNDAAQSYAEWIPARFDAETSIDWTPVWSLTHQRFRYIPAAYAYYGYPPERSGFCRADSNGNAAGNTLEEAILQGFLEIVERDGVSLWWYNRIPRPAVDLDRFSDPYFGAIRTYYADLGRELWVLDVTADLGIPTYVALSRRTDHAEEHILFGFGAHFEPRLAALRAITEMNQVLPTVRAYERGEPRKMMDLDRLIVQWWKTATLENQPYLAPSATALPSAAPLPIYSHDLLDDVRTCVALAGERGMEVLVLDQTRPDVGLPVVKVIVPPMRHYWPRLGPGRLYGVPVELGWCARMHTEDELNPLPMFY